MYLRFRPGRSQPSQDPQWQVELGGPSGCSECETGGCLGLSCKSVRVPRTLRGFGITGTRHTLEPARVRVGSREGVMRAGDVTQEGRACRQGINRA
ncbi:hypothetical protein Pmani_037241 [Petrolisthes manimaculis]|uniref:Uncharacterized protein n=1 Tax=Petrolisthes manimaculis TaxID=1843537 RepID=A0AAE1TLM7_9EUCA|nr:hypothetical protein Pmani_037241 [Petrolisthes manimaculis]